MRNYLLHDLQITIPQNDTTNVSDSSAIQASTPINPNAHHTPDTISSSLEGIKSVFLIEEQRRQEVQRYREQAERARKAQLVSRTTPQVAKDTVCTICRDTSYKPLYQLVIPNNQIPFISNHTFLTGKEEFFEQKKEDQPVFISHRPVDSLSSVKQILEIKPIVQQYQILDWLIIPTILSLALISIIKISFSKYVKSFSSSLIFSFSADRMLNERSVPLQRVSFLLDLLYFIVMPLFLYNIASYYQVLHYIPYPYYIVLPSVLAVLLLFRIYRRLFTEISGFVSGDRPSMIYLFQNQLLYYRAMGLFLTPLFFLFMYSSEPFRRILPIIFGLLLLIALLLRMFRTISLFIRKGYSILYFLLYLCTLEIVPILLLIKEIFWK